MPRTIDHLVHTHRLARQRAAEDKPVWGRRVDVSDLFHNTALTFTQRRDAIANRLKTNPWYKQADVAEFDGVHDVVNELGTAEDDEEFNGWWDELYDLADIDRVWITTR